ncbi:MAG: hypothetical protein ACTH2H_13080 [Glutamicibacter sp.]
MDSEKHVAGGYEPREALAEIEDASEAMVGATEAPRKIMYAVLAFVATVCTLANYVSWPAFFALFLLIIPLGFWYFLLMRKRPRARPVLRHSGRYMGYVLLFMLTLQVANFWEPGSWGEAGLKWLALFGVLCLCMTGMRTATIKNRLKDANERGV